MSPESIDYFGTAERAFADAEGILHAGHYAVAMREAYLAMLNAARAVIFEKTGNAPKTHSGTRSELFRLIHEGLPFDPKLAALLAKGFETKSDVDYGPRTPVQSDVAQEAIQNARAFLAAAKAVCA